MRVKVHPAEVRSSIVALVVPLAGLAGLAVSEERLVGRSVDGDPDLARLLVDAIGMTSQLMLAPEAVGIVSADGTLQAHHSPCRSLG